MRSRAEPETRRREPVFDNLDAGGRRVSVSGLAVWTQPCKTLRGETLFHIWTGRRQTFYQVGGVSLSVRS